MTLPNKNLPTSAIYISKRITDVGKFEPQPTKTFLHHLNHRVRTKKNEKCKSGTKNPENVLAEQKFTNISNLY